MKIIDIQEEVKIDQGDQVIILEKGDKVQVIKEDEELSLETMVEILKKMKTAGFSFYNPYSGNKSPLSFHLESQHSRVKEVKYIPSDMSISIVRDVSNTTISFKDHVRITLFPDTVYGNVIKVDYRDGSNYSIGYTL